MAQPRPRALGDSYSTATRQQRQWPFDYFHLNSIDQRADGTTLISARNTWAMYELNTANGPDPHARSAAGTRASSSGPAPRTAYQHDATTLANGDDQRVRQRRRAQGPPAVARARAGRSTPATEHGSVLAQFEHTPALSSGSQGNIQQLANGDMFVGWGVRAILLGVQRQPVSCCSTRTCTAPMSPIARYRFPWTGAPASAPAIAAAQPPVGHATVYASWNGDTRTASWRVLAGATAQTLAPVATAAASGFETAITTPGAGPLRRRAGARRLRCACSAPRDGPPARSASQLATSAGWYASSALASRRRFSTAAQPSD